MTYSHINYLIFSILYIFNSDVCRTPQWWGDHKHMYHEQNKKLENDAEDSPGDAAFEQQAIQIHYWRCPPGRIDLGQSHSGYDRCTDLARRMDYRVPLIGWPDRTCTAVQ